MPARVMILLLAALLAVVPAACGGGEDEDVDTLLEETFSGDKKVDSGKLALTAALDAKGNERIQGPITLKLNGPFQREGADELPKFALDASLSGAGLTYQVGATSTGDKGFVLFQNQTYLLSQEVFDQFKSGFEQAQKDSAGDDQGADLATLGIDPRKWLRNARTDGEHDVGDTETIKIVGDVDVPKLVEDIAKAGADPQAQGQGAAQLTEEQQRQLVEAVQRMDVELYTGSDDKTLRRIVVDADVKAPEGNRDFDTADVKLDYSITELNEDQEVQEPSNPRPFEELARQLSALGLGDVGGGRSGSPETSRRDLRRYTRCVERAGNDDEKVQKCADIL